MLLGDQVEYNGQIGIVIGLSDDYYILLLADNTKVKILVGRGL